jgi:hypothetical protein
MQAQYTMELKGGNGDQHVVYAGTRVRVMVSLLATSNESHNACVFRVESSRPGLVLESYTWFASYDNLSVSDDSIPSFQSLPQTLDETSLAGLGYLENVVDFQLSNVTSGTSVFRSGDLVEISFRVPKSFPLDPLVLTPVVEGISSGFDMVPVFPVQPLILNVEALPPTYNTSPRISRLGDVTFLEDQTWTGATFLVDDDEQFPDELIVKAVSSDQRVLPDSGISIEGSGSSRQLSLVPSPNAAGECMVTLSVSDGLDQASQSFLVKIIAVNDAPVISPIPDAQYMDPPGTLEIPFMVTDGDSAPDAINVYVESSNPSVVPYIGMEVLRTDAGRVLRLKPATDLSGSSKITLIVSDGQFNVRSSFNISIQHSNRAPEVAPIENVLMKSGDVLVIPLILNDPDDAISELILSLESNNPELFPLGSLIPSLMPIPQLELRSSEGSSGKATILLKVSDGALESLVQFEVQVDAVNKPPVIGGLHDLMMAEDGTLVHAFTVRDDFTDFEQLSVEVLSLSPDLIHDGGLRLQKGLDGRVELHVQSNPNAHGTAQLKLVADDGQAMVEAFLDVIIESVNDLPSVEIINQLSAKANQTIIVPITLVDSDHSPEQLQLRAESSDQVILDGAGLSFEGLGNIRQLYITPNQHATGQVQITVTATDIEGGQAEASILLDVTQDHQNVQTWDTWKEWTQENPLPDNLNFPEQDADGDGVPNWLEMVFASDPLSSKNQGWPKVIPKGRNPVSTAPALEYFQDKRLEGFVEVKVRAITNLQGGEAIPLELSVEEMGGGIKRIRLTIPPGVPSGVAVFFIIETQLL